MPDADKVLAAPPARTKLHRESNKLGFILYEGFYGPWIFLKTAYRQLVVLLGMFVMGAAIFSYYQSLSPLESLLASVSTITTIGLYVPGNFNDLPHLEAILLIVLILVSVGAGASIVQSTVGSVVNGELAKGEVEKRLIKRLKQHTIVFGYEHLGRFVADKLQELGLDYVVVTKNPHLYDELLGKKVFAVQELEGRPVDSLKEAGIDSASTVIVSHQSDPDNLILILAARKMRPDVRIIGVVHDPNMIETAKEAGADVVIPASVTVGHLLALSAITKDLVGVVFSEKIGTKEIAQFTVFPRSVLIGKGMQDVAKLAMVIGVVRGESVEQNIFDPSFRLKENDTVLVLGDPSNLHSLEEEARAD